MKSKKNNKQANNVKKKYEKILEKIKNPAITGILISVIFTIIVVLFVGTYYLDITLCTAYMLIIFLVLYVIMLAILIFFGKELEKELDIDYYSRIVNIVLSTGASFGIITNFIYMIHYIKYQEDCSAEIFIIIFLLFILIIIYKPYNNDEKAKKLMIKKKEEYKAFANKYNALLKKYDYEYDSCHYVKFCYGYFKNADLDNTFRGYARLTKTTLYLLGSKNEIKVPSEYEYSLSIVEGKKIELPHEYVIKYGEIDYYTLAGSVRREQYISGGGSNLERAAIAKLLAGDTAAIIASREPIKTEYKDIDDRKLYIKLKSGTLVIINGVGVYNSLLDYIPEKEEE